MTIPARNAVVVAAVAVVDAAVAVVDAVAAVVALALRSSNEFVEQVLIRV